MQLALTPDLYTSTLRQEILPLRENGLITQKMMLDAAKLDSFVREAGRINPVSMSVCPFHPSTFQCLYTPPVPRCYYYSLTASLYSWP